MSSLRVTSGEIEGGARDLLSHFEVLGLEGVGELNIGIAKSRNLTRPFGVSLWSRGVEVYA
jgi:hypothetical protein